MMFYGHQALQLTAAVLSLLVGLYVPAVLSHKNGAPNCDNLTPNHDNFVAQSSDAPYSVDFSPEIFKGGDTITVTIKGKLSESFKGFAIAARVQGSDVNHGTFTAVLGTHSIQACSHSVLTHSSNNIKSMLSFNWTSPTDLTPGLRFTTTIVKDKQTFWTNLETPLNSPFTEITDTSTKSGNTPENVNNTWTCSKRFTCQVSWSVDAFNSVTSFEFRLAVETGRSYIALGLSEDSEMGSDSVMECLYKNGQIKGQYSYNDGDDNAKVADITLTSSKFVDGLMTCNFTRDNVMNNLKIFNIGQEPWYLLIATGPLKENEFQKKQHSYTSVSHQKVDFMKSERIHSEEESEILVHLHGILMIFAWVFFASVGMFAAHYSKPINKKLCKIMLWFQIHRIFMVTVMLLTVIGFILIFVENEGEYSDDFTSKTANAHPPLGIIVTIFVIFNPILGYFRPEKQSPKRVYFNWIHRIVGAIAMILADVAIFIGVLMHSKMEGFEKMYNAFVIEMSLYVVYKFVAYCIIDVMEYCNQGKVSAIEMNAPGEKNPETSDVKKEKRMTILLLGHTVICLAFAIALTATLFMKA